MIGKIKFNPDSILRSAFRLGEISKELKEKQDPNLFLLLKRESSYLLQRTITFWLKLRIRR